MNDEGLDGKTIGEMAEISETDEHSRMDLQDMDESND